MNPCDGKAALPDFESGPFSHLGTPPQQQLLCHKTGKDASPKPKKRKRSIVRDDGQKLKQFGYHEDNETHSDEWDKPKVSYRKSFVSALHTRRCVERRVSA